MLIPAAALINSPHSDLHLGVSFLGLPAPSTPAPASYCSPLPARMAPLSADPRPLLAFLLYFGFSASLPWVLGHLGLWFPGKSSHPLPMNIFLNLTKGIQNQPAVTIHTHPPSTCSSPGDWQHQVGAQKRNVHVSLWFPVAQPSQEPQLTRRWGSLTLVTSGPQVTRSLSCSHGISLAEMLCYPPRQHSSEEPCILSSFFFG